MPDIQIDNYLCVCCGQCVLSCPNLLFARKNLSEVPTLVPQANELCISCAHCVAACPVGAISVGEIQPEMCQTIPKESIPRFEHIASLARIRRSIRHFENKPLEKEKIESLLDVVRWAPSARNELPVKWIVVSGEDKMKELGELMVQWMRPNEKFQRQVEAWDRGTDVILRGAPTLVIAYTGSQAIWPETDSAIAVQTLDYCAAAMRLGSCWAGYFVQAAQNDPAIASWIGLKKSEKVQAALMLGYRGPEVYNKIPYRKEIDLRWIR